MDKPDSCVVVIFGASGDLTKRKLMPALFALFKQGLLSDEFAILGTSRSLYSDDDAVTVVVEGGVANLRILHPKTPHPAAVPEGVEAEGEHDQEGIATRAPRRSCRA